MFYVSSNLKFIDMKIFNEEQSNIKLYDMFHIIQFFVLLMKLKQFLYINNYNLKNV